MQVQELIQKHFKRLRDSVLKIQMPQNRFISQKILSLYKHCWNPTVPLFGDSSAMPLVDGACSYARALDNCVAFGALLPDQPDLMHQTNEYLELDKLDIWMKIYLDAIYRLAK